MVSLRALQTDLQLQVISFLRAETYMSLPPDQGFRQQFLLPFTVRTLRRLSSALAVLFSPGGYDYCYEQADSFHKPQGIYLGQKQYRENITKQRKHHQTMHSLHTY